MAKVGDTMTWQFIAQIDEYGELSLEWYKGKGNVVTICLSAANHAINWAALVEGVSHHGCIKGYPGIAALGEVKPPPDRGDEHG